MRIAWILGLQMSCDWERFLGWMFVKRISNRVLKVQKDTRTLRVLIPTKKIQFSMLLMPMPPLGIAYIVIGDAMLGLFDSLDNPKMQRLLRLYSYGAYIFQ